MKNNKSELRNIYSLKRKNLSDYQINKRSILISKKLLDIPIWDKEFYHIFLTSKKNNEIETKFILSMLAQKNKKVVVPRLIDLNNLEHILLTKQTILKENSYGIPEPQKYNNKIIFPQELDVIIVPLYIFDLNGNRVGYGKGYYDRFLKNCRDDVIKIGISLFEPVKSISGISRNDIALNYAITSNSIFNFQ
tara:strand:+ start:477 stop:1052 length:576 start_codon:yes stop_codon:yes gene_type:complete